MQSTANPQRAPAPPVDYPHSLKLAALWLSRQPEGGLERVVEGLRIDELQLARWRATLARPR